MPATRVIRRIATLAAVAAAVRGTPPAAVCTADPLRSVSGLQLMSGGHEHRSSFTAVFRNPNKYGLFRSSLAAPSIWISCVPRRQQARTLCAPPQPVAQQLLIHLPD